MKLKHYFIALSVFGLSFNLGVAGDNECSVDMNTITKECATSEDPNEFDGKGAKCGYSKRPVYRQFANCPALSVAECMKEPEVCKLVGSKCVTALDNPDKCADRTDAQASYCGKYRSLNSDQQEKMNCLCSKRGDVSCIVNCGTLSQDACGTEPRGCTWNSDSNECVRNTAG